MDKVKYLKKNGNESSMQNGFDSGPMSGMSWKEWKDKRKEDYKKWKEGKLEKKRKKLVEEEKLKETQAVNERVTENANKSPNYTISIAVPGSILDNAQSPELKTYLAGQIARAAAVFNVNEIIVYSETSLENLNDDQGLKLHKKLHHGCTQLVKILQYLECPQYLRKYYFPFHKDLEYAGLLNPLDLPHHLRVDDESKYREGTVISKPVKPGKGSYVYIGLNKLAVIDKILEDNVRVTVMLDEEQKHKKHFKGIAVSPSTPYKSDKIYWGYNVRLAKGLSSVFSESPFKGGYDLTIGTSDKGQNADAVKLPKFRHLLIVFGGLKGIESALESDESIQTNDASSLFNFYLNTCPSQGSRTIRTEEAILITMATLRPEISGTKTSS